MGLLMNGDIYVKIIPEIIEPDTNEIKKINEEIYDLSFEEAINGLSDDEITRKEKLEELKRELLEQDYDYETTDDFHLLKILENKINIICYLRCGIKQTIICDLKELREKYVRMIDFLAEAKYIGKEFRRTDSLDYNDIKIVDYMKKEKDTTTKVLYKTDYAMLAEYKSKNSRYFEMIKPIYFEDGKYKFVGKQDNSYNNKKQVLKSVADEIENRYQYYKKYYENK